ncbi:MAG: hypothetical protein GY866_25275 [Proteobacteria bacterium]|nr:hypothetical protein [Pseudomonadota bacterium]
MLIPDLLVPLYCANCRNLTFLATPRNEPGGTLIDYVETSWRQHPCVFVNQKLTLENPHVLEALKLQWGIRKIPFLHQKPLKPSRKQIHSLGIILSIPPEEDENRFLKAVTTENDIVEIKVLNPPPDLSAGALINLSKMTRVGSGKFRMREIDQIVLPENIARHYALDEEYYQLTLSADDQELLESFINRLLGIFLKQKFSPCSVVPLPITRNADGQIYHRQVNMPPQSDLLKRIENISIPESIQFSVRQIKP